MPEGVRWTPPPRVPYIGKVTIGRHRLGRKSERLADGLADDPIVILAAIALFLILRLRNVLGTREGFEKPQEMTGPTRSRRRERSFEVIEGGSQDPDIADFIDPETPAGQALAAMKRADRTSTCPNSRTAPGPPTR